MYYMHIENMEATMDETGNAQLSIINSMWRKSYNCKGALRAIRSVRAARKENNVNIIRTTAGHQTGPL